MCRFQETLENGYSQFHSVANKTRYVGFLDNGSPIKNRIPKQGKNYYFFKDNKKPDFDLIYEARNVIPSNKPHLHRHQKHRNNNNNNHQQSIGMSGGRKINSQKNHQQQQQSRLNEQNINNNYKNVNNSYINNNSNKTMKGKRPRKKARLNNLLNKQHHKRNNNAKKINQKINNQNMLLLPKNNISSSSRSSSTTTILPLPLTVSTVIPPRSRHAHAKQEMNYRNYQRLHHQVEFD